MNKNGWKVVSRLLDKKGKNQSWLAKKLGVTPAAITQIKKGLFKLNEKNIEKTTKKWLTIPNIRGTM